MIFLTFFLQSTYHKSTVHSTYNIRYVLIKQILLLRLPISSRLLLVKFRESQRLHSDFQPHGMSPWCNRRDTWMVWHWSARGGWWEAARQMLQEGRMGDESRGSGGQGATEVAGFVPPCESHTISPSKAFLVEPEKVPLAPDVCSPGGTGQREARAPAPEGLRNYWGHGQSPPWTRIQASPPQFSQR